MSQNQKGSLKPSSGMSKQSGAGADSHPPVKPTQHDRPEQAAGLHDYRFIGSQKIDYLESIAARQLDLYAWCEDKVGTLATINSVLLAGATLLVGHVKNGSFPVRTADTIVNQIRIAIEGNFAVITTFGLLLFFMSLGIALYHVIPKMYSGASSSRLRNHRSVVGINKYKTVEEYKERLDTMSEEDLYDDLVRQIYGVNKHIWRNQRSIRVAVYLDLAGLLVFLCALAYLAFNGNGLTILS